MSDTNIPAGLASSGPPPQPACAPTTADNPSKAIGEATRWTRGRNRKSETRYAVHFSTSHYAADGCTAGDIQLGIHRNDELDSGRHRLPMRVMVVMDIRSAEQLALRLTERVRLCREHNAAIAATKGA